MATMYLCFVFMVTFCTILSHTVAVTDDTVYQELLSRIEDLERKGQELHKKHTEDMENLKTQVEIQNQKITDQEIMIHGYKQRVTELEGMITHILQEKEVEPKDDHNDDINVELPNDLIRGNMSKTGYIATVPKVNAIRKQRQVPEGPIGFHAVIKQFEVAHIGVNQKIVFSDVMLNLGGGYHNQHGIFTAPRPGIYIFSTSIMAYYNGSVVIYVHLVKNGQILANAYAAGDAAESTYNQGSVTVVTQLAAGDDVWVTLYGPADTHLHGNYFDSFMGLLIHDI